MMVSLFLGRLAFSLWDCLFSLGMTLRKILTMDSLRKWHVMVVNRCYMCKKNGEFADHLLLHYTFLNRFGLSWVMPNRVVDLFACWYICGHSQSVVVWKMMPYCLLWYRWKERNNQNFEDQEMTLEELKSFFYSLYTWTATFLAPLVSSFNSYERFH